MKTDNLRKVVFNFGDASDDEDSKSVSIHNEERKSSEHSSNIKLIDIDDFKRIEFKRNTRKNKTEVPTKKLFTIEKFSDEITKITEDLEIECTLTSSLDVIPEEDEIEKRSSLRKGTRQRTIKFHNKKTRFQYPKEVDTKTETEPDSDSKANDCDDDAREGTDALA